MKDPHEWWCRERGDAPKASFGTLNALKDAFGTLNAP